MSETKQPDFEGFARAIMERALEEGYIDGIEGDDLEELAQLHGILVKTAYDPAKHGDSDGEVEPGEGWYVPWWCDA